MLLFLLWLFLQAVATAAGNGGSSGKCGDGCERLLVRKRVDKRVFDQFSDVIRSIASQPAKGREQKTTRDDNKQAQTSGRRSRGPPESKESVMVLRGWEGERERRNKGNNSEAKQTETKTRNERKGELYRDEIKAHYKVRECRKKHSGAEAH